MQIIDNRIKDLPSVDDEYEIYNHDFDSGTFNQIKLVKYKNNKLAILRSPLNTNDGDDEDSDDEDSNKDYNENNSVLYAYHSSLFSHIVKQKIFPHFPLTIFTEYKDNTYSIMQEYANKKSLTEFKLFSKYEVKNIFVQSLISLYFMNTQLQISHNDPSTNNILIKSIPKTKITYKFQHNKTITIQTQYLALLTDFDHARGVNQNYCNNYCIRFYLSNICYKLYKQYKNKKTKIGDITIDNIGSYHCVKLSKIFDNDSHTIKLIKNVYKYLRCNHHKTLKWDITIFFTSAFYNSVITKKLYIKVLEKYILNDKINFYDLVHMFLPVNYLKPSSENIIKLYNINFDYSVLKYKNSQHIYNKLFNTECVRGLFLNHFIMREFNLYKIINPNYCIDIYENPKRQKLFESIQNIAKSYYYADNTLQNIYRLVDYVYSKSEQSDKFITKYNYKLLGYMCCIFFQDEDLYEKMTFNDKIIHSKYARYQCIDMIKYIIKVLATK